jgi:hypothetical protein
MPLRIFLWPGVTHANVKGTVGTEGEAAAVMNICDGIQPEEQLQRLSRIGCQVGGSVALEDQRGELPSIYYVLYNVIPAVLLKVRMKSQAE